MKKARTVRRGVVKGAPSGFVISLLVHVAAFMLAGLLVVFTVHQKEEKKFVPPKPVDRPKMKLKKPKVKVKKSAKPKSTQRIVTKVKKASMPDIQLPEMSGMSDRLGADFGGFDLGSVEMMPSLVGQDISTGTDLEGTFYTLMRDRQGRSRAMYSNDEHMAVMRNFIKRGFKSSVFNRFYRSPKKLYASTIMVPISFSNIVPKFFGESDKDSQYWFVHYKGEIVYPEDITFRFVAQADACVAVQLNGKIVLGAVWHSVQGEVMGDIWRSRSADNRKWWMGNWTAEVGDWITLKANEPQKIEVLICDSNGLACLMLAVQEKGVDYPSRAGGGPYLPAFKTAKLTRSMHDIIQRDMVDGEVNLYGGPIFNDLGSHASTNEFNVNTEVEPPEPTVIDVPGQGRKEYDLRIWGDPEESSVEGRFVTFMGDKVVLKNSHGKMRKLAFDHLTAEDRQYLDLTNPPKLDVSVSRSEAMVCAYVDGSKSETIGYDLTFTGKVKRRNNRDYPYELTAEFYVIGKQHYANVFMLLNRQETAFVLGTETEFSFSDDKIVHTRKILPREWVSFDSDVRGEAYYGYLMVVKDKRGRIVAYNSTSDWFIKHYDKLRDFPVNGYMNKSVEQVSPKGPKRAYY